MAKHLAEYLGDRKDAKILDACAGTGLAAIKVIWIYCVTIVYQCLTCQLMMSFHFCEGIIIKRGDV